MPSTYFVPATMGLHAWYHADHPGYSEPVVGWFVYPDSCDRYGAPAVVAASVNRVGVVHPAYDDLIGLYATGDKPDRTANIRAHEAFEARMSPASNSNATAGK